MSRGEKKTAGIRYLIRADGMERGESISPDAGEGWSPERSPLHPRLLVAVAREARLHVALNPKSSYIMSFSAIAPPPEGNEKQRIAVYLNEYELMETVLSEGWTKHALLLDRNRISNGTNEIRFHFARLMHPSPNGPRATAIDLLRIEPVAGAKVLIADEERDAVSTTPEKPFRVRVKLDGPAELSFGYAGVGRPRGDTSFSVTAKSNGNTYEIFTDNLTEPDSRWREASVDLSRFGPGRLSITFATPGERTEGVWGNPVILPRRGLLRDSDGMNVVLISIDTLRRDHLGCYGYSRNTSPCIDQLAREGCVLENAASPACWTLPAHIGMLTGLHPLRFLHHRVGASVSNAYSIFMRDGTTLARILKQAGYLTAAFTGGGLVAGSLGFSRGFGSYYNGHIRFPHHAPDKTGRTYRAATEWLRRYAGNKFFLFFHTYETHLPHLHRRFARTVPAGARLEALQRERPLAAVTFPAESEEEREYAIDLYDSSIACADHYVGLLLEELGRLRVLDRTLVILASDHGEELWERGSCWSHRTLYDEVIRVPVIFLNFPAGSRGTRFAPAASLVDIVPTLLSTLGIRADGPLDGVDLFSRKARPRGRVVLSLGCYSIFDPALLLSLRTDEYKYIANCPWGNGAIQESLYHLPRNPREQDCTGDPDPELQSGLKRLLLTLVERYHGRLGGDAPAAEVDVYTEEENREFLERLRALGYV